ncbi:hypothetical protein BJY14_003792 [Actinomadura luteofluorescens]|uniref:Uncharacterized protein n=1 Tax=Actinomadura luteofluorescens TaxID=46163 RepID=A0A7Y9EHG7_9ACTN|nr:hypothetical protein [Actinomadura luteofluorescens]
MTTSGSEPISSGSKKSRTSSHERSGTCQMVPEHKSRWEIRQGGCRGVVLLGRCWLLRRASVATDGGWPGVRSQGLQGPVL